MIFAEKVFLYHWNLKKRNLDGKIFKTLIFVTIDNCKMGFSMVKTCDEIYVMQKAYEINM